MVGREYIAVLISNGGNKRFGGDAPRGNAGLPVIPNRQAGSLSHRPMSGVGCH